MSANSNQPNDVVRIELSEPQKTQVKNAIGKDAEAIVLGIEELEERIAPRVPSGDHR